MKGKVLLVCNTAVHFQQIHNANSSSSHSVILGRNPRGSSNECIEDQEFGWEFFTCATAREKSLYILQSYRYGSVTRPDCVLQLFPEITQEDLNSDSGYIDHQSVGTLTAPDIDRIPETEDEKYIWNLWYRYVVSNPQFIIVGGNDNSNDDANSVVDIALTEPIHDEIAAMVQEVFAGASITVTKQGSVEVVLSSSGKRVIIDWEKHGVPSVQSPVLVDLKITDYCNFGCKFCYQGSTKEGKHVPLQDLKVIVDQLHNAGVVELVIGGGEPTQHPDFLEFIRYVKDKKMHLSFTTKSIAWIHEQDNEDFLLENILGEVAFSVKSLTDLRKIEAEFVIANKESYLHRVQFQCIDRVTQAYEIGRILKYAFLQGLKITILGFKDIGRGATYEKRGDEDSTFNTILSFVLDLPRVEFVKMTPDSKYGYFEEQYNIEHICKSYTFALSVDTLFAQKVDKEKLKAALDSHTRFKYNDHMFREEGVFSCYIDPLTKSIHTSSYQKSENNTFKYDAHNNIQLGLAWSKVRQHKEVTK